MEDLVSRARRLKYVWSRLLRFYKRCRNMGDTNQIAERSIITKLLRVSHMTVCPFQTRCYREKSVSESWALARLQPNQQRVISFKINDGVRRWCLKCTGQLEQNRKHMLCRITCEASDVPSPLLLTEKASTSLPTAHIVNIR